MTLSEKPQIGHVVGGEMTAPRDLRDLVDPGRLDDVVAQVAVGTAADVDHAVQQAHAAFAVWRAVPPAERAQKLLAAADILARSADELAPLLVREHGGVMWEAQTDFALGTGVLQHTAGLIEDFSRPVEYDDEQSRILIERLPRGVAAAIVPWNMPIVLAMMKVAPALATGNTMVLKPSPFAPAALTIALQRMSEVFPPGVINVVHGDTEVGEALTTHPLVRKIGFTGGTETARHVMRAAAGTIKNLTLELGGNDPAIVLDDVDIESALDRKLNGIIARTGQICFAVKRIYVPRGMYDDFVDALVDRLANLTVGHGLDSRSNFGPLNNKKQYDSVNGMIHEAKKSSARVLELGRRLDPDSWENGYYLLPHVVRDVEHEAPISRTEQFGPVIPVIAYDDEDQVVRWANDSEYGLGSSVWTNDPDRGFAIARQIEAGSTFINSHSFESLDLRMPFGGVKESGIGREFGKAGMREYVEDHAIRLLK
jgi:acyl-CoA reductase-like NAD-dependent aldehyde dehydrogenase